MEWNTNKKYSYNSIGLIEAIYHGKGSSKWDKEHINMMKKGN